eukprot:Lankesteria_metandrocarpae@DN2974_c0_g1_i1.p1
MIQDSKGSVIITNDGATILKEIAVTQPAAKMLVELSKAQDSEAGDGTTSVAVLAGALLEAAERLFDRGIHPQTISAAFFRCSNKAEEILKAMAKPVDLTDRESLVHSASTALQSKVVSQKSTLLAPLAVDAVMKVIDPAVDTNVDLNNIRVVKRLGGTVDDTELVPGLIFSQQRIVRSAGGPTLIKNAKIALIQFCVAPPKTDMENNITVKDYNAIDRLLREERVLVAKIVKRIAATGCNVLLIQKSILRDATTALSLDYLAKAKIMVIKDIEREDIDFISRTLGCDPAASIEHLTADKLGNAELVAEDNDPAGGRIVRVTGVQRSGTISILCRASNSLILDEAERSLHDALCVVRCLVKRRFLLPGGGAAEMELSQKLHSWSRTLIGFDQLCARGFAEAMEIIPFTLAENAGLRPIEVVTELRNRHAQGEVDAGIDVRRQGAANMEKEKVVQPLLVTLSAVRLATETVMMILKIDDMVMTR